MAPRSLRSATRRFAGRPDTPPGREDEFAALAEALLSPPPVAPAPPTPATRRDDTPAGREAPDGLYVLIPSGIEPAHRRAAALAAASRLAPPSRPTVIFVLENGRVDAHVVGEMACGRLGPQNYLGPADVDRTVAHLVGECEQIGIAALDGRADTWRQLGRAARRAVFVATPDAESVVETYRSLKAWCLGSGSSDASLMVIGEAAGNGIDRLRRAARGFLGCELAVQRLAASEPAVVAESYPAPLQVLSNTPAEVVWSRLLAAVDAPAEPGARAAEADRRGAEPPVAAPVEAPPAPVGAASGEVCPAFSLWQPADRGELIAAVEGQAPSLLAPSLTQVFRVGVTEAGAPPLAAVREDGALVAVLLPEQGKPADTRAAERWLMVHRSLLERAYPSAGIRVEAGVTSVALAPVAAPSRRDGVLRFVPVKMGGHRGIILL